MDKEKNLEISIIDYIVLFVKYKKFLIGYTFLVMLVFYLGVFFLVEEQYDSKATVVPSNDNSLGGIASMLGDIGSLPFGLGGSSNPEIGLYNTILASRTTAELIINEFNLWEVYGFNSEEPREVKKARERFWDNLGFEETDDGAYAISMRTPDPELSAKITNFLLSYLNNKIIELKIDKSKKNRIFLEERLDDVRTQLTQSEDSLKRFQAKTGLLVPEEQIKGILSAYSLLEKDLITKQLQKEVLEHIYSESSPQLKNISTEVELFQRKIDNIKKNGEERSIFIPYDSIPNSAIEYYRLYREIEINGTILEFVLPLYEQARLEEQKDIPILQVIDPAIPAEEKSFPRRSLLTLAFGFGVFIILFGYKVLCSNKNLQNSDKYEYIVHNLFKWKTTNGISS